MCDSVTPHPYAHWMLREIFEQPETLAAALERYVDRGGFREAACAPIFSWLEAAREKIVIAASGSSRHAGLAAELMIEDMAAIAVDVEYASEYCYRPEKAHSNPAVMVISQSGETADTLAALRKAAAAGRQTLAITNVEHSTMASEATVSFPVMAGRERAIPATKSFTAQLLNLHLLSLMAAVSKDSIAPDDLKQALQDAAALPGKIEAQLRGWERAAERVAEELGRATSFLFLGRGLHYPVSREGALKLKESAYLYAEGYPSGELKHGPNALVTEGTPLVMLATVDHTVPESVQRYERVVHLLRDMREQGAEILAIANTDDDAVAKLATYTIFVDEMKEPLLAICEVIPLQLLAYFMAVSHGIDVDHPRNLTKAVVTE